MADLTISNDRKLKDHPNLCADLVNLDGFGKPTGHQKLEIEN